MEPIQINTFAKQPNFVLLEINGYLIWWPDDYPAHELATVWQEVFVPAANNPHAYEYAGAVINNGDWVIDCGASEGFFIYYALERGANVLAIEPVTQLTGSLNRTFATEIAKGRVKVLRGLVGMEDGLKNITVPPGSVCGSSKYIHLRNHPGGEECPQYTIDSLLAGGIVPRVDFIKMDIEGSEVEALYGAAQTVQKFRPKLSLCAYHHPDHARQLKELILFYRPDYKLAVKKGAVNGMARPIMVHAY